MFAVANRVAIFSNGFNFQFDRTQPLGMVCPTILEENSEYRKEDFTIFVLYLSLDDDGFEDLKESLENMNGEMLLFLRRLRCFTVSYDDEEVSYLYNLAQDGMASISTFTKGLEWGKEYYRHACKWKMIPTHLKRIGDLTETVLAFPLSDNGPVIEFQDIFAFLPLRRTSFCVPSVLLLTLIIQFLAHADFLTQANRQGILEGEHWNRELGIKIAGSFMKAIPGLKKIPSIVTRFIEYIPNPEDLVYDRFLQQIAQRIVQNLKTEPILLSRGEEWITPSEAMIVPPEFIIAGEPLFDEDTLNEFTESSPPYRYLSAGAAYTTSRCQMVLKVLNCQTFSIEIVLQIVKHPLFAFSQMPESWLPMFFVVLYKLSPQNNSRFLDLPFLKLQNGEWASRATSIYIPNSWVALPDQIDLDTLDPAFWDAIEKYPYASRFLTNSLGLKKLTNERVIETIINYHIKIGKGPSNISSTVLLEHAQYLSELIPEVLELSPNWLKMLKLSFHLFDRAGRPSPNNEIVLDGVFKWSGGEYLLSSINSNAVRILHEDYTKHNGLMTFINSCLQVRKLPSLLDQSRASKFFTHDLAPKRQGDNRLLYLLAEPEIWDGIDDYNKAAIRNELQRVTAFCEDKCLRDLRHCYLRTRELTALLTPEMNALQLFDPNNAKWRFLQDLGVTIRPNLKLYLGKLRWLKAGSIRTLQQQVGIIYHKLETGCPLNEQQTLRYVFI